MALWRWFKGFEHELLISQMSVYCSTNDEADANANKDESGIFRVTPSSSTSL